MGASLLAVAKSIYYTTTLRKMIKKRERDRIPPPPCPLQRSP